VWGPAEGNGADVAGVILNGEWRSQLQAGELRRRLTLIGLRNVGCRLRAFECRTRINGFTVEC